MPSNEFRRLHPTHNSHSRPRQWMIGATRKRTFTSSMISAGSRQFVMQRLCLFQVDGVEAFGEPAVDRREKIAGFGAAALVAAEPGEAHGGAQLPELRFLLPGDAQGFAIQLLSGLGIT